MPRRTSLPTSLALASCAWVALAPALPALGTGVQKPERSAVEPWHEPGWIAVKFRDREPIRARGGALDDGGAGVLAAARGALLGAARGTWERTHHLDEAELARLHANARARSGQALPDPNLEFRLRLAPGLDPAAALDALNVLAIVELAWPLARPAPPPVAPDFSGQQGYLGPATAGTDARAGWLLPGGIGARVRVCDIEYEFNPAHVDLPPIAVLGPPSAPTGFGTEHATAVLGMLFARPDGAGVTGAAHGAGARYAAAFTAGGWNVAAAVTNAMAGLGPGDVIVIEQQNFGPAGPGAWVPMEWDFAVYNAIQNAVAAGIVVVEAAANGGQDLDQPIYNQIHAPFRPENDSGAILVGAGGSPAGAWGDRSRISASNYGSTIDLQGWGESVVTCGYGQLYSAEGPNAYYTASFSGTSSATPMVAAACAQLQALHLAATGSTLTPRDVRDALRASGSPQQAGVNPVTQNIGPRPDLAAAVLSLGIVRCAEDAPWIAAGAGASARRRAAAAYDSARSRALLFGGEDGAQAKLGDTWAWVRGGGWQQLASSGPAPRAGAGLAHDRRRDRAVLFGGVGAAGALGDTWEFDGSTWSQRSLAGPPAGEAVLAWDAERARVVLVAGDGAGAANATWEWDGASWSPQPGGPTGRDGAALAYDAARGRLVLFGGEQSGAGRLGDTWERAGTAWTLVPAAGPSPRSGAGLAWHAVRGRCVLLGGDAGSPSAEAWSFDGAAWSIELASPAPRARARHAQVWHDAQGALLVYGGEEAGQSASAATWVRARDVQPGIPFCFGDGSGASCPCANASAAMDCAGCLNAHGAGGRLRSTGIASLAADSVALVASGLGSTAALFQGDAAQAGGSGTPFGNGLRCAGGTLVRLLTQPTAQGALGYPPLGGTPLAQRGGVTAPGTRTYQAWSRDGAGFCTGSGWNLSNGLRISWAL